MSEFLSPEDFLAAVKGEIAATGSFKARKEIRMGSGPEISIAEDSSGGNRSTYMVTSKMGDQSMSGTFDSLADAVKGADSLASGVTKRFDHRAGKTPA